MKYVCISDGCRWVGTPRPVGRWVSGRRGEGLRYNGLCCPFCGGELVGFDVLKDTHDAKIIPVGSENHIGTTVRCQKGHEKEIIFDGKKINVNKIWINPPDLKLPTCCKTVTDLALTFLRKQYEK